MSKEPQPEKDDQLPDLTSLDFGPSWARKDKGDNRGKERGKERGKAERKKSPKSSDGKPSHGVGSGGQKSNRGHRGGERGQTHDRRGGRGGRGDERRGGQGKGRDRRDFSKGGRHGKSVVAPPDGVKARIMPIEEGLDAMAKQISATGRTHSIFELAWVVLGGLDRFHIIFESDQQLLYRSKSDHSCWLSQRECLAHIWASGLVNKYYDEEITEVDPPTGNFQSVARCGLSGTLIGPPNHHAYQQALVDLHRERFSSMPMDRYKSKIVMEHSEDAVQEWMDAMRKHKRWRPKTGGADGESQDANMPEASEASEKPEETGAGAPTDEVPTDETPADTTEASAPIIEETVVILDNQREVEQHFLAHGFELEFVGGNIISTLANIPQKMISPGLISLLNNTVAEEKRYPGNLASILCRQMSGRHLAVFKWKKRLHCGPARPRHVSDDMVMADRPSVLFHWVIAHPGGSIDVMWKECLPSDIDDDVRHLWYHDLHWLINEGLVLLFADGTLHAAKELEKKPALQKPGGAGKMPKKKGPVQSTAEASQVAATKPATVAPDGDASQGGAPESPSSNEGSLPGEDTTDEDTGATDIDQSDQD